MLRCLVWNNELQQYLQRHHMLLRYCENYSQTDCEWNSVMISEGKRKLNEDFDIKPRIAELVKHFPTHVGSA